MRKIYILGCMLLLQLSSNLFAQAPYCGISGTGTDFYINNFSTTGGVSNISNLASGFGANNYEDATAMTVSQFVGGPAVNFTVDFGSGSGYTFGVGIWVDWNNNSTFDSAEQMYISGGYNNTFSGSFSVPAGTPVGTYRMRVLADFNNSAPTDPCALNSGNGEAEDYTFEVITPPSCLPVSNLTLDGVTFNSADISWTVQGTETNWNIEYGVSGFTLGTGMTGTASGTAQFTGSSLNPNTSYDFYVQADCGGGDESVWLGPISAYTGYCEFQGTDPDYYINNFSTTGGATSNISNLNSGISAGGYEDATAMVVSQFEGGPDVNFTVNFGMQSSYTFGFGIWVDWNDNMIFESNEQMFQSLSYQSDFSGSFGVPLGTAVGNYRMRIMADYYNSTPDDPCTLNSGEGEAEDYTFEVVPIPTCMPVTDLATSNETTNTIDITWTAGGSESNWNIEWGAPGFTPGTGTGLDSAQVTTESFTVPGLNPATDYDIYVQASCSSSDSSYWTMVSGTTLCAPIATLPWTEDFEGMNQFGAGIVPYCWLAENGQWFTDNGNNTGNIANSGTNFAGIYYGSNDYLWTPEFQLTAGTTYEFSFMWAGDGYQGWNGSVVVNGSQSSTGATALGTAFISSSQSPDEDYNKEFFCFTPMTSGVYSFGVKVTSSFNPYMLRFDDFSLIARGNNAGTNGTMDACQIEGLVDLETVATITDAQGGWTFAGNPSAIENGNQFNPEFVPAGTVSVDYITYGCLVDTVSAMITIYPPSSAGLDGTITACKNNPVDLYSGLNGTVDMGGDWYNPTNNLMPSSQFNTGTFPGQYNYKYIAGNGVCPDDTASVVVTVTNCNWLSVDEHTLESVNVYPNPSSGLVYIESGLSTEKVNLVVTDINGRVVETGSHVISNGVNTVDLSKVQRGTYFFKLSGESAEKVIRVVIQ
jgi:hypothetical protein